MHFMESVIKVYPRMKKLWQLSISVLAVNIQNSALIELDRLVLKLFSYCRDKLPVSFLMYINTCKKLGVLPNSSILSSFDKALLQKSNQEPCSLEIILDRLKDSDFPPLIDIFSIIDSSEIDAIDIIHESPFILLNGEGVLSLICAIGRKIRIVDLHDLSFQKRFLRDLFERGFTCQALNLRGSQIRKLCMTGKFMQLHSLNLDFSISITNFHEECFSCMPNLVCLSMCETSISNLWNTTAALSKLPSLKELRFQNCLCCTDTGPCPASSGGKKNSLIHETLRSYKPPTYRSARPPSVPRGSWVVQNVDRLRSEGSVTDFYSDDESFFGDGFIQSTTEESSDDSETEILGRQRSTFGEILSDMSPSISTVSDPETFVNMASPANYTDAFDDVNMRSTDECLHSGDGEQISTYGAEHLKVGMREYTSNHPSPICFERYYREFMLFSLPKLHVLDNLPVKDVEKENARMVLSQYYECLPYNRQSKRNVTQILRKRELGPTMGFHEASKLSLYYSEKVHRSFSRSISSAKVSSSAWPLLQCLSKFCSITGRNREHGFRPRQFEYHPSDPCLMVFGTLDGELVVVNHESGKLVGYLPSIGALHSVLGLCWLKKHPTKLIAGSETGSLQLYDICQMPSTVVDRFHSSDAAIRTFDEFEQLTSVHVNSTDELFLASGYSRDVALYDIASGKRMQIFKNLHREHINVVKFAHHSPSIFATSSFDQEIKLWDLRQGMYESCYTAYSSRGNVMVCFSPDDQFLLSSAVDNEVKQFSAADGRLHMAFNIAPTGSGQNYTRSYYMNGRDYIISGSCEENVVRVCCAQTGRRLRDVSLEGRLPRNSMFVQSLRGDPFRDFHMSILAAYLRPSSKSEIIKVNLLASSSDFAKDNCYGSHLRPPHNMGG